MALEPGWRATGAPHKRNNGYPEDLGFNCVFTRAVNHLVIVLGNKAARSAKTEGRVVRVG